MNLQAADQLVSAIQGMDRPALTEALLTIRAPFPVDFSPSFLQDWPLDKLRHVLFAAAVHSGVAR